MPRLGPRCTLAARLAPRFAQYGALGDRLEIALREAPRILLLAGFGRLAAELAGTLIAALAVHVSPLAPRAVAGPPAGPIE
ncbi:MAG: hypothetical protein VB138_13315 [Burkholderia sp.]